jgi:16S rRNA (cytosine1402-N4)-methyltransferase
MLQPCIDGLDIKTDGTYIDLTFGGGGHAREILKKLGANGRLLVFDKDAQAYQNYKDLNDTRVTFIASDFRYLKKYLRLHDVIPVDGILADLGISSHQIDEGERGFSTRYDGPLDMRMDAKQAKSAATLVNESTQEELQEIFWRFGELANGRQVAQCITRYRAIQLIETTAQLKDAISSIAPRGKEFKFQAQVFQALRIVVNDEMAGLGEMLLQCAECIKPEGRLVIMSYHSLEDRQVKNYMLRGNLEGEIVKDFYGNDLLPFKATPRKAIEASPEEIAQNSRARSAKLRIGIRI